MHVSSIFRVIECESEQLYQEGMLFLLENMNMAGDELVQEMFHVNLLDFVALAC